MSTTIEEQVLDPKRFRNSTKPIWCPGCGDHSVLGALVDALGELGLAPANVAVISGIGCSSRLPGYLSCYGFNSIHGRAIPIATGVKAARPEMTVVAVGGDGDGFAIGGNHPLHAVRRNIDLTYIVMDNGIYGLTKGQVSPTTPVGVRTKTTPTGAYELPVNPLEIMLGYGSSFVAQAFAGDMKYMRSLFVDAIKHPGFSFVNVVSPCPTYRGGLEQFKALRAMQHALAPEEFDETDWIAALKMAKDHSALHVGVFHREIRPTFQEQQAELAQSLLKLKEPQTVNALADMYR
jgi:2-oxoglutarate/2-oxoacid ferredoxin oxidoreductase subunit beta